MTEITVIVRKHEPTDFYGAEIFCGGAIIGATAITSIQIEKIGENLTCYKLIRQIGEIEHTVVGLYNVTLDIKCDNAADLIKVSE